MIICIKKKLTFTNFTYKDNLTKYLKYNSNLYAHLLIVELLIIANV